MPDRLVLVSYRPTALQALGRGLFYGALVTTCAVLLVTVVFLLVGTGTLGAPVMLAILLVPVAVGGATGLVVFRRCGVDVDARGVCAVSADRIGADEVQLWPRIVDLRTERRGGRTEVTAYLDTGSAVRLRAPYDGRLLARDPGFEHKYFTLRHIWETHRSWNIPA